MSATMVDVIDSMQAAVAASENEKGDLERQLQEAKADHASAIAAIKVLEDAATPQVKTRARAASVNEKRRAMSNEAK